MEEKKKNIRHVLNIIVILFITMILVSGGTFAYLRWISSTDQQTGLAIQIEENINMHIENPLLTKAGMYPTNTCTNEAATMSGVSVIALENQTGVIARPKFKLRVKITDKNGNVITNNSAGSANSDNPYRYFINYAVAEENGTCTEPLYSGNFDQNAPTYQGQTQWYDSEWITLINGTTGFPLISNGQDSGVSFNGTPYQTTYHNYKVWVWIDESYVSVNTGDVVSDKLQDAKIELSWSENSTVQQIKAQAYAVFSSSEEGGDNSLRFYQSDEPITEDSTYAGRPVTNVYTGFETENYNDFNETPWYGIHQSVESVVFEDTIAPISTAWWFAHFNNCSYVDVTKLDTSNVTNMTHMFSHTGYYATAFEIAGMNNWNTSNVTNMTAMFMSVGDSVTGTLEIVGLENWDTSNLNKMTYMFRYAGQNAATFNISDLSDWDVSKVTKMAGMFDNTGLNSTNNWSLDLSDWNVYNVTESTNFENSNNITPPTWYTSYAVYSNQDNSLRFYRTQTDLTQQSTWNDLSITEVYTGIDTMVYESRDDIPWKQFDDVITIDKVVVEDTISPISTANWFSYFESSYFDLTKLNTSNVTTMGSMFAYATVDSIIGLENWNVSNVTNMGSMFFESGSDPGLDLSRWNVSNVTNMNYMFAYAHGSIIGLENWNVSNVTNMMGMFESCFNDNIIDLSKWNVSNVTNHTYFDLNIEGTIVSPKWVN